MEADTQESGEMDTETLLLDAVYVYVCGAVTRPGVYRLAADARIGDAIEAAGGMEPEAAAEYWNLAQPVTDGQKIAVPTIEQVQEWKDAGDERADYPSEEAVEKEDVTDEQKDGRININTASAEVLTQIPGVGNSRAESIVAYREEHGDFARIEDIMKVSGIKTGIFEGMKDYICV